MTAKALKLYAFVLVALTAGCSRSECKNLIEEMTAEDAIRIEEWIKKQHPFEVLNTTSSPLIPGDKLIDIPLHDIPIGKLERPVSASVIHGLDEDVAVFLGYRNFQGLLISMAPSEGFIQVPVSPLSLHSIIPNVAVVCLGRD